MKESKAYQLVHVVKPKYVNYLDHVYAKYLDAAKIIRNINRVETIGRWYVRRVRLFR